jgi:uncharacterized membrane-anchored protein YhcB (DUF1043 family)
MEIVSLNGLILIISVCIIAFLIGYFVSGGREDNKRLKKELKESREELKNYRSEVTSHFQETAHKVNALTENYRNVYEHLARGAQSLCDKTDAPELMNELNHNLMLGGETVESPEVNHEVASAEADASNDLGPDSEPENINENPDDTTDTITTEDQAEPTGAEADLGNNSAEDSETDKNSDRDSAYPDENNSDESIIAAEESAEPDKQTPEQKSAT